MMSTDRMREIANDDEEDPEKREMADILLFMIRLRTGESSESESKEKSSEG